MNGHWHSKSGTSYVGFKRNTTDSFSETVPQKIIQNWPKNLYFIERKDVNFQKETAVPRKDIEKWQNTLYYIEYKDVDVGPIWSHDDFLNRKHTFAEKGGSGWVLNGQWTTKNGVSYAGFRKCTRAKVVQVVEKEDKSTTMNTVVTTKDMATETDLSGIIFDDLILTTEHNEGR